MRTNAGLLVLLLALGCSDDHLPLLETERLRFHGDLDGTCEALGRMFERELSRVEASLGREVLEPIDIHVGDTAIERWCSASVPPGQPLPSGCAPSGTLLATSLPSLSHELVHAVRRQHDIYGAALIEEGLATMYGNARPSVSYSIAFDTSNPEFAFIPRLEHDHLEETNSDRLIAAHFLDWLGEAYGREPLLAFLWSDGVREGAPATVQAAFADAIGETMLAAQDRWSEDSEHEAVFADLCRGIDTAPLPPAGLLVEGPACCTDPSAEQGELNVVSFGSRCFTLSTPTELQVELHSGDGQLVLRPDGCPPSPVVLGPGESETITALACRWKVIFVSTEQCDETPGYRYSVTPL
jgi:hypothetical protein